MIDAVMYGMIPSAKMVKRRRLPPLNRSKMPSTEPCPCWNKVSSTRVLMPGVGMCAPMRYTASSARVNNTRFRKSGMRKRFRNASINRLITITLDPGLPALAFALARYLTSQKRQRDCRTPKTSRYNLERAARLGNLFLGRRAERMRVNRDLGGQLAVPEDLHPVVAAPHKSVGPQKLRGYRFSRRENIQLFQVQDRVFDPERIVKAALGHAAVQRHLPAFEAAAAGIAAPRFLPFIARARGLAQLRTHAPA